MTSKVSKEMVFGFYGLLILVLAFVGYLLGKKTIKEMEYTGIGVALGILLSSILWMTVGKKIVNDY